MRELWTIGHSTRDMKDFIALLKKHKIAILADVRSLPGSNKYPQYNQENMVKDLENSGIAYRYMKDLGGLRKKNKHSHNTVWRNASFRNYADYMETPEFEKAIKELVKIAVENRTCICCAEAVWWRCHRSMIADYMKSKGWTVHHILSSKKTEEHPYTGPAQIIDSELVYGSGSEQYE